MIRYVSREIPNFRVREPGLTESLMEEAMKREGIDDIGGQALSRSAQYSQIKFSKYESVLNERNWSSTDTLEILSLCRENCLELVQEQEVCFSFLFPLLLPIN